MKKYLYLSLTFIISFIALSTNVSALENTLTCTYYADTEQIKNFTNYKFEEEAVIINCDIDQDSLSDSISGKAVGYNLCVRNNANNPTYNKSIGRIWNWTYDDDVFQGDIGSGGYKAYVKSKNTCPNYIFMDCKEDSCDAHFVSSIDVIKETYSSGMQNASSITIFIGSLKKNDAEAGDIQDDINDSDATKGEVPDYALPDDKEYQQNHVEMVCGLFGTGVFEYIQLAWNLIKYATPILIIILGILEFVKVVFSGEDKDLKAAGQKFIKQIIIGVVIILLPILLGFIIDLVGFSEDCLQHLL